MPDEKPSIIEALASVQRDVDPVGKTKEQKQDGYKYRGIDGALNALHPALAKHGVVVLPQLTELVVTPWPHYKTDAWRLYQAHVTFELWGPAGDHLDVRIVGEGLDNGDKGVGKALSYAYKTMAWQVFSIPLDTAQDNEATDLPEPESRPARSRSSSSEERPVERAQAEPARSAPWDGPRWEAYGTRKGVDISKLRTFYGEGFEDLTWDDIAAQDEAARREVTDLIKNWQDRVDPFTGRAYAAGTEPAPSDEPEKQEADPEPAKRSKRAEALAAVESDLAGNGASGAGEPSEPVGASTD